MRQLIIVPLALLAACSDSASQDETASALQAPVNAPAPEANRTPVVEDPDGPGTAQAAAAVLRRYFDLFETGRLEEAVDLWWDESQAAEFAAELSRLGDFDPNIAGPGRVDGAAGSLYVSISLQLLGPKSESLKDGTAILRRVNEVPGSTAEQRRWRIDRISLQPPPQPL